MPPTAVYFQLPVNWHAVTPLLSQLENIASECLGNLTNFMLKLNK